MQSATSIILLCLGFSIWGAVQAQWRRQKARCMLTYGVRYAGIITGKAKFSPIRENGFSPRYKIEYAFSLENEEKITLIRNAAAKEKEFAQDVEEGVNYISLPPALRAAYSIEEAQIPKSDWHSYFLGEELTVLYHPSTGISMLERQALLESKRITFYVYAACTLLLMGILAQLSE